jgi:hypothetical protein
LLTEVIVSVEYSESALAGLETSKDGMAVVATARRQAMAIAGAARLITIALVGCLLVLESFFPFESALNPKKSFMSSASLPKL